MREDDGENLSFDSRPGAADTNNQEGVTWNEVAMGEFELNEQMFRDFQEGLKEIKKLNQNPADEVGRKRFEKKWKNHDVRDVLALFMPSESRG